MSLLNAEFLNIIRVCCKITYFAIKNNSNMSIFYFLSKVNIAILPPLKYGIAFDVVWGAEKTNW